MTDAKTSVIDPHPRKRVQVLDTEMSYVDTGRGDPIVFLHGNPTSSYLWRNIIPYVAEYGRCLAPDLVGMGRSGKSPARAYRFVDHVRYLDAWFDALDLNRNIILVLHDWGSALGFHRAFRHRDQVQAIVYMEAIAQPRRWEDFPNGRDAMFRALRSEQGEHMVLDENFFIEVVLPKSIIRKLSDEEMTAYRAPFLDREARLPTLRMAARVADREHSGRRSRDRRTLWRMARRERSSKALHQCRSWCPGRRTYSRLLPRLAEPTGSHRYGHPLYPRGFARPDRRRDAGVRRQAFADEVQQKACGSFSPNPSASAANSSSLSADARRTPELAMPIGRLTNTGNLTT